MKKIIIDNRPHLIGQPYFLALDIQDNDCQKNKPVRQTRVVNLYNNQVG